MRNLTGVLCALILSALLPRPILHANTFDMGAALEAWVERGQAPNQIVASHAINGVVDRTRPLCPYPQTAVYKGSGSIDEAANFECRTP